MYIFIYDYFDDVFNSADCAKSCETIIANNELEIVGGVAVVIKYEKPLRYLPAATEKNHDNLQLD